MERTFKDKNLELFSTTIRTELSEYLEAIDEKMFNEALSLIQTARECGGRVHITGIGKPSHVAEYHAALFSSIGTPTYFLDGTEAVHGSAGQVLPSDVVIAISNSGNTTELKAAIEALRKIGAKIIGVSGNSTSYLAAQSDAFLYAGVNQEGDTMNKPPRLSILAETIVLQMLSVLLQDANELDFNKYYLWHPGGALGASVKTEVEEAK